MPRVWMRQAGTTTTCFRTPSVLTQLGDQAVTEITKGFGSAGVSMRADFAAISGIAAQFSERFWNRMSAGGGQTWNPSAGSGPKGGEVEPPFPRAEARGFYRRPAHAGPSRMAETSLGCWIPSGGIPSMPTVSGAVRLFVGSWCSPVNRSGRDYGASAGRRRILRQVPGLKAEKLMTPFPWSEARGFYRRPAHAGPSRMADTSLGCTPVSVESHICRLRADVGHPASCFWFRPGVWA